MSSENRTAMREFRFLEERRRLGGLTFEEGQRWEELRLQLGVELPADLQAQAAEASAHGYYGEDGLWYAYPTAGDASFGDSTYGADAQPGSGYDTSGGDGGPLLHAGLAEADPYGSTLGSSPFPAPWPSMQTEPDAAELVGDDEIIEVGEEDVSPISAEEWLPEPIAAPSLLTSAPPPPSAVGARPRDDTDQWLASEAEAAPVREMPLGVTESPTLRLDPATLPLLPQTPAVAQRPSWPATEDEEPVLELGAEEVDPVLVTEAVELPRPAEPPAALPSSLLPELPSEVSPSGAEAAADPSPPASSPGSAPTADARQEAPPEPSPSFGEGFSQPPAAPGFADAPTFASSAAFASPLTERAELPPEGLGAALAPSVVAAEPEWMNLTAPGIFLVSGSPPETSEGPELTAPAAPFPPPPEPVAEPPRQLHAPLLGERPDGPTLGGGDSEAALQARVAELLAPPSETSAFAAPGPTVAAVDPSSGMAKGVEPSPVLDLGHGPGSLPAVRLPAEVSASEDEPRTLVSPRPQAIELPSLEEDTPGGDAPSVLIAAPADFVSPGRFPTADAREAIALDDDGGNAGTSELVLSGTLADLANPGSSELQGPSAFADAAEPVPLASNVDFIDEPELKATGHSYVVAPATPEATPAPPLELPLAEVSGEFDISVTESEPTRVAPAPAAPEPSVVVFLSDPQSEEAAPEPTQILPRPTLPEPVAAAAPPEPPPVPLARIALTQLPVALSPVPEPVLELEVEVDADPAPAPALQPIRTTPPVLAGPGAISAAKAAAIPPHPSSPVPSSDAPPPTEEAVELASEPAPLSMTYVPGEHRVVIHTLEGLVKRGLVRDLDLLDPELRFEPQGSSDPERLEARKLKAIFFMLPPGARPPPPRGQKLRVTFSDGRQVAGQSEDHRSDGSGFFLIPNDNRTNTSRIYIFRSSVMSIHED